MTARLAFLGTPHAAVPTLEALASEHDVVLVVTQPDRPQGRSQKPVPPPVRETADRLGLEVAQPGSHRELLGALEDSAPIDLGVVVAYGRILRPETLRVPGRGFLNVHFSLLPRWRGAAPVSRALMAGDPMTGVTVMKLDEGLDTGPVLTAQAIDVEPGENAGELTSRLARLGARLLTESIGPYLDGELEPTPQTGEGATYADKVGPSDRPIRASDEVQATVNKVRGLAPDPAATIRIEGAPHKILEVAPADSGPPQGRWLILDGIPVAGLADGGIELLTLQPPGKTVMTGADWARGRRDSGGTIG